VQAQEAGKPEKERAFYSDDEDEDAKDDAMPKYTMSSPNSPR
jgi:hypothetical protein